MLALVGAAILAFLGIQLGLFLEIACEEPDTPAEEMCNRNATIIKWFSSVALFVITVVGAYRFVTNRAPRR